MTFPEKSSLVKRQNELISNYGKYVELLTEEAREVIPIAYNHGWRSKRIEKGIEIKNKIEQLKNDIDWLQS